MKKQIEIQPEENKEKSLKDCFLYAVIGNKVYTKGDIARYQDDTEPLEKNPLWNNLVEMAQGLAIDISAEIPADTPNWYKPFMLADLICVAQGAEDTAQEGRKLYSELHKQCFGK